MNALAVLLLPYTATPDEIHRQYRLLASQAHPDKGGSPERFQAIQSAYDKLKDRKTPCRLELKTPDGRLLNLQYLKRDVALNEIRIVKQAIAQVDKMIQTATETQRAMRWHEDDDRSRGQFAPLLKRKAELEQDIQDLEIAGSE